MKKHFLEINTTTGAVRVNGSALPAEGLTVVHGDVILLAAAFTESIPESISGAIAETAVDFTEGGAPLGLRFTCDDSRAEAATLLTFQDAYNSGIWAEENLQSGRVSWLVDFGAAAVTSALGSEESISVWGEFALLTAANYPQTLVQFRITVLAQIDNGAVGSPPPSSPTNQTAADALTDYSVIPTVSDVAATGPVTSANGRRIYMVDTSAGAVNLTLPALSGIDAAYRPDFVLAVAGNTLTITPAGADTINGAASMTINTQYGRAALIPDATNTNWIAPTEANP